MSFEEKELNILRKAVDKAQELSGKKIINSPEVQHIIHIVEMFLKTKKLICYGGTAINNILPLHDQFYNKDIEIPDYDFFSANALEDAKELANIYAKAGYEDIEAKSGVHHGTFKVFINFIPVADITFIPSPLFKVLTQNALQVNGILYAPPDFLRMSMYLELSRPLGDVSRWEKVLKRLTLLNRNYPLKNIKCNHIEFMRKFEGTKEDASNIYNVVRDTVIRLGLVFLGGYANTLYSKYMPNTVKQRFNKSNPDFDILSEDPLGSANIIVERLRETGYNKVKHKKWDGLGEIIAPHYEIIVNEDTIAFIYQPIACHSYNVININNKDIKVATIDTMLSFYLAFLYANRPYYDHDRIFCMSQYLFMVQSRNRLQQKGLLKRFSLNCIGEQPTLETMRNEKTEMFEKLKNKRDTKEYEEWFLKYTPLSVPKAKNKKTQKSKPKSKPKSKTKTKSNQWY
uniref:Poly(A) polymerase catalytic subunit domain-containing protein n=1 Tax=viral metagenome TaxID=1070528 RepID=A0A6C0JU92_9ZZZZ